MKKILIAGGTGMIGRALSQHLNMAGYEVHWLSRSAKRGPYPTHQWDVENGHMDDGALDGVWGVVNLSGAGIVDKSWSKERKRILKESRVGGNGLLLGRILAMEKQPKVFLAASAIGIYGNRPNETVTEESTLGSESEFLVRLCRQWEESTDALTATSIARITLRIGLVLSNEGGILQRLGQTMPFGITGYFGNGMQGASWIHIDDLCRMILHVMDSESQVYNLVSPNPTNFKHLVQSMAKRVGLGLALPVPTAMLKLVMGTRSEAVLQDLKAIPQSALETDFKFKYPKLDDALDHLMSN